MKDVHESDEKSDTDTVIYSEDELSGDLSQPESHNVNEQHLQDGAKTVEVEHDENSQSNYPPKLADDISGKQTIFYLYKVTFCSDSREISKVQILQ